MPFPQMAQYKLDRDEHLQYTWTVIRHAQGHLIGSRRMWKTVGSGLLRVTALYCVFGVFGIAWVCVSRFYSGPRRSE